MEEARPRFVERAQIVVQGAHPGVFEWDGEFFKIPRTSIRPRPISHPERRFYASSVSPESAEIMAKLGFGLPRDHAERVPKAARTSSATATHPSVGTRRGRRSSPTNISVADSRAEGQSAPRST
jgi:alkanesulfonate monooxygenase SsuD/methylene tetrahydromethanopterin reductase-like flavin-dependent oxidoreductase (luciferase family)